MFNKLNDKKKTFILISILCITIICLIFFLGIFVWATNGNNEQGDINEEETIIEVNNEIIENEVSEEKVQSDIYTETKNKINTETRVTKSGEKYTSIGLINIPKLGIEYEILSSTSDELLKISVTKYWGPEPNEVGNLCILGHNYREDSSQFFGKLLNIEKGEKIYITDLNGKTLMYTVYETDVIEEDDVSCTSQKTNGNTEVTLITCYYEQGHKMATKRFIVKGRVE